MRMMPKWNPNATSFEVSIDYDKERGSIVYFPAPLLEKMNMPKSIQFVWKDNRIYVTPGKGDKGQDQQPPSEKPTVEEDEE